MKAENKILIFITTFFILQEFYEKNKHSQKVIKIKFDYIMAIIAVKSMNEWFNNDINIIIISFEVSDTDTEIKQKKILGNFRKNCLFFLKISSRNF